MEQKTKFCMRMRVKNTHMDPFLLRQQNIKYLYEKKKQTEK